MTNESKLPVTRGARRAIMTLLALLAALAALQSLGANPAQAIAQEGVLA